MFICGKKVAKEELGSYACNESSQNKKKIVFEFGIRNE